MWLLSLEAGSGSGLEGDPSYRHGSVHFAICLREDNFHLWASFLSFVQLWNSMIPGKNFKDATFLSHSPTSPSSTHSCMTSQEAMHTESFILSRLERGVWQRLEPLGTLLIHSELLGTTRNYTSPPKLNVSSSLFLSGKPTLHLAKKSCLYLAQFTLFKLYLGVSVAVKNSIQHVIGENIMEILK